MISFFKYKIHYTNLVFILLFTFYSCKNKKQIVSTEPKQEISKTPDSTANEKCKMDFKSGKALAKHLKENELDFNYANAKFNCNLTFDNEEHSFNVSVRCRKDSVIWMSISKLGIDAARALITRDTVKIMLGLTEKKYFIGDFSYINELLQANLDFDMIQALLFGNSANFYDEDEKLKPGKDKVNCNYFLSTVKKRSLKKINNGEKQPDENYQTIWLHPTTFKIVMLEFDDIKTNRKFNACYDEFNTIDNYLAPYKLVYSISAEKNIKADIQYSKISLNEVLTFPFRIPSSYEPIQVNRK
jgi:hypothetical protein